jgi:hypothetical protein
MKSLTNPTVVKPLLLGVLLAGLVAVVAVAQEQPPRIADPEWDYVKSPHPEFGGLSDDQVVRLDLDLDGDGKATVFLTLKKFGSKSGYTWTAYDPVEGGGYRRIDNTTDGNLIQFRTDTVFAGQYPDLTDRGGLLVFYYGKRGVGNLYRYEIRNGIASSQELRVLDFAKEEDKKLFAAIFKREVDQPLPAEHFTKPPYRVLSATSIRAKSPNEPLSPAPVEAPKPPAAPPVRSMPAPVATASSPPTPAVADTPAPMVERKSPVWPWLVGIAALTVIALLVRKHPA